MVSQRSWVLIPLLGCLVGCAPASPPGSAQDGTAAASSTAGPAPTAAMGTAGSSIRRTGEDLFDGNCTACHQSSGRGIPGIYPSLAGSPTVLGDPEALARWVIEGERARSMRPDRYSTVMPRFGWLKDAEAAALFTYLRSSFGNRAPPVDAATVASALEE